MLATYMKEDVLGHSEGDIVRVGGKRYRLQKKTTTACAFTRWYWWDDLIAKITGTVGRNKDL